jgi:hypothetical protein
LQRFLTKEKNNKHEKELSPITDKKQPPKEVKQNQYMKVKNGAPERFRESINESQSNVNRSKRGLSIFEVDNFKESIDQSSLLLFHPDGLRSELEHYLELDFVNETLDKGEKQR